jgi:hypothetical protein
MLKLYGSRITYSVLVAVPPAPPSLAVHDVRHDSVMLTWTRPQANLLGYILSYRPEGGQVYNLSNLFLWHNTIFWFLKKVNKDGMWRRELLRIIEKQNAKFN